MYFLYHINMFSYVALQPEFIIGRAQGNLTFVDDSRMSSLHAKFTYLPDDRMVFVEDLGSKNKTIVNRVQIAPHEKVRIKIFSLIEIGSQQFILTDSKSLTIQNINEILDHHLQKSIVKLEKDNTSTTDIKLLKASEEASEQDIAVRNLIQEIDKLETLTKNQLKQLDEQRARVLHQSQVKKQELQLMLQKAQTEAAMKKEDYKRYRQEVEQKKKKVIKLTDLVSSEDPTE